MLWEPRSPNWYPREDVAVISEGISVVVMVCEEGAILSLKSGWRWMYRDGPDIYMGNSAFVPIRK